MKLGMFMHPIHDFRRGYHTLLNEDMDVIRCADAVGFDEVWLGEHFALPSEPIQSPLMLMAALIPETERIKLCTGVICLPNQHPAIVAGQVAQFDHMTKGRFMFGIGPGAAPPDFEMFKVLDFLNVEEQQLPPVERLLRGGRVATRELCRQSFELRVEAPSTLVGEMFRVRADDDDDGSIAVGERVSKMDEVLPPLELIVDHVLGFGRHTEVPGGVHGQQRGGYQTRRRHQTGPPNGEPGPRSKQCFARTGEPIAAFLAHESARSSRTGRACRIARTKAVLARTTWRSRIMTGQMSAGRFTRLSAIAAALGCVAEPVGGRTARGKLTR